MQHNITELRRDLQQVQDALTLPGVTPQMRIIFNSTIAKIKRKIEEASQTPPAPAAVPQPKEAKRFQMSVQPERQQPETPRRSATPNTTNRPATPPNEDMGLVTAMEGGPVKKVKIRWNEMETVELTEGETRSRFVTALRDLAESKKAAEKRWDDVARYRTFARACTYYEALMVFWPHRPTPEQLGLTRMSEGKQVIFNMIHGEMLQKTA